MYDKYYVIKWKKNGEEIHSTYFSGKEHENMEEFVFGLVRLQGVEEIWKETVEHWSDK